MNKGLNGFSKIKALATYTPLLFKSNTTWSIPVGTKELIIFAVGGGGGGGAGNGVNGYFTQGGGGGSGFLTIASFSEITDQTLSIVIGTGGVGGITGNGTQNGSAGGQTVITSPSNKINVTANAGQGGSGGGYVNTNQGYGGAGHNNGKDGATGFFAAAWTLTEGMALAKMANSGNGGLPAFLGMGCGGKGLFTGVNGENGSSGAVLILYK